MLAEELTTSQILNLFTPWLIFGVVIFALARTQYWIKQHLFGIGLIWLGKKERAAWIYILVLLPGILLRELSRWTVAGMLGQKPTFITPGPQIDDDGVVHFRLFHYTILNPVYIGILAATPMVVGFSIMLAISYGALNLPQLLALLGSAESAALRQAFGALLSRADLPIWIYLLFTITNTMLPTLRELRSTWFLWVIFGAFMCFLLVLGMYNAILMLLAGPIATAIYTLTTVYGSVAAVNLLMLLVISVVEAIFSRLTNRKVEYRPAPLQPRRSALEAPRTIYELRLPTPPPPSRALSAGAALKLGMGKVPEGELPARAEGTDLPAAQPEPELIKAPPRRRATPTPAPAHQTGESPRPLPAPPQPKEPPAPTPAKPLPLMPPARQTGTLMGNAPEPTAAAGEVIEGEVIEGKDDGQLRYVPVDEA
ncbi:MAG: hypothetical protein CUN50_04100 [Candidatus Thermofonsia Clade 1 bacterium]|jgi:hypothetical protein|uniref:Uncharacterized protein n=1 Tax=Candidatus Thermofonsia Clade 1 bacterium TaxID=2364210 RepID=A0A2M8PY34_9CHLR|nr:MAG: hypothetical protein CUN50_04100 [Candidatus Thermofonsia Clade 1 bacterium]